MSGTWSMMNLKLLAWLFLTVRSNGLSPCDSDIWCNGQLLHDIQTAKLYPDSKMFVDMNIKVDPAVVSSAYQNLSHEGPPSMQQLQTFVDMYFDGPGTEFENWTPTDYNDSPAFLSRIKDENLKVFGQNLCQIWSRLGRKIKDDVRDNPQRYSLIYLKNPFIVPGGRFREIYYWDSYWVVQGLLTCGMTSTVKGMLENLISFIPRYGLVPNGGRIYYTQRSQPPLLMTMVDQYVTATGDVDFLRANIDMLVKEMEFWDTNRSVTLDGNILYRYASPISTPRPESYREDYKMGQNFTAGNNREEFYSNIASAAESGWDFSTRWFSRDFKKYRKSTWLHHIDTKDILPVDLNSIMCSNKGVLANFYKKIGNQTEYKRWNRKFSTQVTAVNTTFWDSAEGTWFDIRISDKSKNNNFYPSNLFPLFTGCFPQSNIASYATQAVNYLKRTGVLSYTSGIPTSLTDSGQQWDFPNGWPPLQHTMIISLARTEGESRKAALKLAQAWVESNYEGWKRTGKMFEKYVVTEKGSRGGGGEYDVQEGFGWTNGVVLDLLNKFGDELTYQRSTNAAVVPTSQKAMLMLMTFFTCIWLSFLMYEL